MEFFLKGAEYPHLNTGPLKLILTGCMWWMRVVSNRVSKWFLAEFPRRCSKYFISFTMTDTYKIFIFQSADIKRFLEVRRSFYIARGSTI